MISNYFALNCDINFRDKIEFNFTKLHGKKDSLRKAWQSLRQTKRTIAISFYYPLMVSQYFFCPSGCFASLSYSLQLHLPPFRELLCPCQTLHSFAYIPLRSIPLLHFSDCQVHPLPIILRAGATHCDCGIL